MFARDMMTRNVIAVDANDSILKVAQIMFEHNFDGLPVIVMDSTLIGLVTQYDLVTKGANIHLPTFLRLIAQLSVYKKDQTLLKPELKKIVTLTVRDVMNAEPLTVLDSTPIEDVARMFAEHHRVNPLPVVNEQKKLVGIISRFDLIKLYTGTMANADAITHETSIDRKMDLFVQGFGKNFLVVSKFTPVFWKVVSFLFVIVGFVIAMALIIRF